MRLTGKRLLAVQRIPNGLAGMRYEPGQTITPTAGWKFHQAAASDQPAWPRRWSGGLLKFHGRKIVRRGPARFRFERSYTMSRR